MKMTRLFSRARLHTPRAPETGRPKRFRFATAIISGCTGNSRRHSSHIARAIDILGARVNDCSQALMMARGGRCYSARAGKLDQALVFAGQAREVADDLNNAELRAWCAMKAEPYYYRGHWNEAVMAAESALPVAWEIGEWAVVIFSSAWLAIAYSKLGQPDEARRILDRVFNEVPARLSSRMVPIPYAQIARAQIQLTAGQPQRGPDTVRQALAAAERRPFASKKSRPIEFSGKSMKRWGIGPRPTLRSAAVSKFCEKIQCPPELAQTLLAYGRFRRGDNAQEDRPLLERALRLFEEMKATGWIEEARAALAAASPV